MKKNSIKTTTLSALVAVSKTDSGMDYVQVMPDDPVVGMVEPFHGSGYGQLLSNGTFDFTRRKRKRRKPDLKLKHGSVSFGDDGFDRMVFVLPNGQRKDFARLLLQEAAEAATFVYTRSLPPTPPSREGRSAPK
ncbi:MAG: hypothetical protein K6C10_08685 [Prevotella sp.]|nr:hypothetical protein [Prevotella sp.]